VIKLQVGRSYRSRDGFVWVCYRIRPNHAVQARADCIRVDDSRVEYFYEDGRYDVAGKREHCLIEEVVDKQTTKIHFENHDTIVDIAKRVNEALNPFDLAFEDLIEDLDYDRANGTYTVTIRRVTIRRRSGVKS
jgi:hypothetical protein